MSIKKAYEVTCETCGSSEPYVNCNKEETIRLAKQYGWIIKRNRCYCSQECLKNYRRIKNEIQKKASSD